MPISNNVFKRCNFIIKQATFLFFVLYEQMAAYKSCADYRLRPGLSEYGFDNGQVLSFISSTFNYRPAPMHLDYYSYLSAS